MTTIWFAPMLAVVVVLAVVGLALLYRAWPRRAALSEEERAEIADAPMPPLQRRAVLGLAIGAATAAIVTWLVASNGAAEYWDNDALRLRVVAVFIAGLVAHSLVPALLMLKDEMTGIVDERDRAILARAPIVQSTAVLLTLAAWMVSLGQWFHDAGAVPMVYMYLIFGSVILVMMIAQSAGVLLFYWLGSGDGQG